jgi:hypothetical protein
VEARIREGRWTDPDAGKTTVSEWIDRWLAIQDVGVSTEYNRDYLIRRFIRPAWGATELSALSTEEITKWENAIPATTGVSVRTARAARTLLGTRAAISPHSPVPLLDELLAPISQQDPPVRTGTTSDTATSTGTGGQGEDDLPNSSQTPGRPHPGNAGGVCPTSL